MVTMSLLGWVVGEDWINKVEQLRDMAIERKLSIACAESCTGGLLSALLTKVSGISLVYKGTCVTYSNESKSQVLHVPAQLIQKNGAVSEPVALAMACGVKKLMEADLSVAITGIAGPQGGTPDKPVGMVCFAASGLGSYSLVKTQYFQGSRGEIQEASVAYALDLLLDLVNM
jgi:nicotinamide-nucleotide amidase